jgi:hypothetical protein
MKAAEFLTTGGDTMAAKKTTKTRKATRAKATKKSSVRSSRKAPGALLKAPGAVSGKTFDVINIT